MAKISVRLDCEQTAKKLLSELSEFEQEGLLGCGMWFIDPKNKKRVRLHVKNKDAADFIQFIYV